MRLRGILHDEIIDDNSHCCRPKLINEKPNITEDVKNESLQCNTSHDCSDDRNNTIVLDLDNKSDSILLIQESSVKVKILIEKMRYAFSTEGKWKQIWTQAHTILGVVGFPFQLVYGVTGALFGISLLFLVLE